MNSEYLNKSMISTISTENGTLTITSMVNMPFPPQLDNLRPANKNAFENDILRQIALYRLMKKTAVLK